MRSNISLLVSILPKENGLAAMLSYIESRSSRVRRSSVSMYLVFLKNVLFVMRCVLIALLCKSVLSMTMANMRPLQIWWCLITAVSAFTYAYEMYVMILAITCPSPGSLKQLRISRRASSTGNWPLELRQILLFVLLDRLFHFSENIITYS